MIYPSFGGVNNIVRCHNVNGDARQRGIDLYVMAGGTAVASGVSSGGGHRVSGFTEHAHSGRRNGHAPVTGSIGCGGVILPVEHHGYLRARRLVAAAGNRQIRAFLGGVDDVVDGDGVNAEYRSTERHADDVRGCAAVACGVGDRGGNGHIALRQCGNHAGRHADAPVAVGVQHGGVGGRANRHGNRVTCGRARCRAADNLRLAVFRGVDDVIARYRVDGNDRSGKVHRQIMRCRGRISGFVADRCVDGIRAGGEIR